MLGFAHNSLHVLPALRGYIPYLDRYLSWSRHQAGTRGRRALRLRADNWYKLHADALQMLLILGEAATVLGCGITKVLQFLAGGGLACTQGAFDLALGRRAPLSLDARRNTDKVLIPLDLAH